MEMDWDFTTIFENNIEQFRNSSELRNEDGEMTTIVHWEGKPLGKRVKQKEIPWSKTESSGRNSF